MKNIHSCLILLLLSTFTRNQVPTTPASPCFYTCLSQTCVGTTAQTCLSCNSQKQRYATSYSAETNSFQCQCIAGYYDDNQNEQCLICSYKCNQCVNPGTICVNCRSGTYRSLMYNSCPCNAGYYDDGSSPTCLQCSYTCATCTAASTSSCVTCPPSTSQRALASNSCPCNAGYFDNGSSITCVACSYTCATCTAASTSSCVTCPPSTSQRALASNSCPCNAGYFDDGSSITCVACSYTCATCTAASTSSCVTCPPSTSQRALASNSCPCNAGYFDNGSSITCVSCSYTCATCTAASTSSCVTCPPSSSQRALASNSCPCNAGYFDNGSSITCVACSYTCATCTAASTSSCVTCPPSSSQRSLSSNSCPCNAGYFDNGSSITCVACSYTCATCTAASTSSCVTCPPSSSQRALASNSCPCNAGYFDNGSSITCVACSYTCATCTAASTSSCVTCPPSTSQRALASNSCPCNAGYFDNGSSITCVACSYTCATCTAASTSSCVTCPPSSSQRSFSTNSCPCNAGYFDNGSSITCVACSYTCATCTAASTLSCVTCPPSSSQRSFSSNSCPCNAGYFDNGSSFNCGVCQYTCFTCTGASISQCVTCPTNRIYGNGYCTCNAGLFDDSSIPACVACSYTCATCSAASTTSCKTCPTNRIYGNSTCTCNVGYFDDGSSPSCKACSYSCQTCSAASKSSCFTCLPDSHRTLQNGTCSCNSGYSDNGSQNICIVLICSYTCLNCSGFTSSSCLTCPNNSFRSLISNSCVCASGYFDDGRAAICVACSYTCAICNGSSIVSCLQCSKIQFRTLSNNACPCDSGYQDNLVPQCASITRVVVTCNLVGVDCINCPDPKYLRVDKPDQQHNCPCIPGTIQQNENLQCQSICGDGIRLSDEECDDGNSISRDGCSSTCKIDQGYHCMEINQLSQCSLIPIQNCLATEVNLQSAQQCLLCKEQYFLTTQNTCQFCHQNCDGCTGPSSLQCKKCSSNATVLTNSPLSLLTSIGCQSCEKSAGLYSTNNTCTALCGDSIVRFDKGEQCDDGNIFSYDGYKILVNDSCSPFCQVEKDFICTPQYPFQQNQVTQSICKLKPYPKAALIYTDQTTNNLELIFDQQIKQSNFCHLFQLTIDSLTSQQFQYQLVNQTTNSCQIQLTLNVSLLSNQYINIKLNDHITDRQDLKLQKNFIRIQSRKFTFYSNQQLAQAHTIAKQQKTLNYLLLLLGLIVIVIGGFEPYWGILDIMTWVDQLYFINVNYPLNIQLFFQLSQWTGIFQIPNPLQLNQSTDAYYQQGPPKFHQKGTDSCFIASVIGDIYFCIGGLFLYIVSSLICKIIEKIYSKKQTIDQITLYQTKVGTQQEEQKNQQRSNELQIPKLLLPIYTQLKEVENNYRAIFIKLLLLVFLDFQTASILQIQAGQFGRHPFIAFNYIISVVFQVCALYLPFYMYSVIDRSPILMNHESYEQKYSGIYEGLLIQTTQGKCYCIFAVIKKTFFIYFLTYFYQRPIIQTITCTMACCVNVVLICFKNPFGDTVDLIRNLVPEIAIFVSIGTTIVFAMDDQSQMMSSDFKYNLGWLILFCLICSILVQCIFLFQLLASKIKERCLYLKKLIFN